MTQVGQGAIVIATIASVTIMAVAGKIDATTAVSVVLGVAGIGSGVSVAAHTVQTVTATREPATPPRESDHVG